MPALRAPTIFAIPPDGNVPIKVFRAWATDIQTAVDGTETREAQRDSAVRRMQYSAAFVNAREAGAFRALWYAAPEPLRFYVPLWREQADPTAIAGAVITADTTDRRFVAGGKAMLWQLAGGVITTELVTVDTFDAATITATAPIAGAFTIGLVSVYPVMTAWLEPPAVEERGYGEIVPLTFHEELTGIAGIDDTIDAEVTPVVATIAVYPVGGGVNPWLRTDTTWIVDARTADGSPVIDPDATWVLSVIDPSIQIQIDVGHQSANITVLPAFGAGSASCTVTVLGVPHTFTAR